MVDSVTTFRDKANLWEITVKSKFLETCPNPNNETIEDLTKKYKFYEHLHNPYGPALICLVPGKEKVRIHFLNAQLCPPDTDEGKAKIQEIEEKTKFNKNFDELIK